VRSGIFWLRTRETTWLETKDPSYLGKLVEQAIRNLGAEYEA